VYVNDVCCKVIVAVAIDLALIVKFLDTEFTKFVFSFAVIVTDAVPAFVLLEYSKS
jgi:hypothetical protein